MINKETPSEFEKLLITEYFKCGSIDKVFKRFSYDLPISFAGYDRVLNKYSVVKSAGPNSKLSESLYVLSLLANYKIPLEKVYHLYAPKSFKVSTNTLHRILHYTRMGLTRRQGAALIISPQNNPDKILLGNDLSLDGHLLGKKGDMSLPMGHSKTNESIKDTVTRILQNEVFTNNVIENKFPWNIIPEHIKPVMIINLADIQVSVYRLFLPKKINLFSSYKLSDIKYYDVNNLPNVDFRPGILEALKHYPNLNQEKARKKIVVFDSDLNTKIFALAKQPVR